MVDFTDIHCVEFAESISLGEIWHALFACQDDWQFGSFSTENTLMVCNTTTNGTVYMYMNRELEATTLPGI